MKTKDQILLLEEGEIIDNLSLDFIVGGAHSSIEHAGECDHCATCGNGGNNSNNGLEHPTVSMG